MIFGRKGDYYRYMAEFKSGDDKKDVADLSMKAYEVTLDRHEILVYIISHLNWDIGLLRLVLLIK